MSDSIFKERINLLFKSEHEYPHKSLVAIFSAHHIIISPKIDVVFLSSNLESCWNDIY